MRNILVVANQTLGGTQLQEVIRRRAEREECAFWVLVPATATADLSVPPPTGMGGMPGASGGAGADGAAAAELRLGRELDRLMASGVKAEGEIGDPDPLRAISDALAGRSFDEIILATLPQGISRWLKQDLVSKVHRRFSLPVTHVVADA